MAGGSTTLHTLKVQIEAYAKPCRDEMAKVKKIVDDTMGRIDKQTGEAGKSYDGMAKDMQKTVTAASKVKEAIASTNTGQFLKNTGKDVVSGSLFKELTAGIREYIREAKLAAGITVFTDDYHEAEQGYEKAARQLEKLKEVKEQLKLFGNTEIVNTEEYTELSKGLELATKKLGELEEKERKYSESGGSKKSTRYKNLISDIEESKKSVDNFKNELAELEASGGTTMSRMTDEWNKNEAAIRRAGMEVDYYQQKMAGLSASGGNIQYASNAMGNGSYIQSAAVGMKQAMSGIRQTVSSARESLMRFIQEIPGVGRVARESAYVASSAFKGLKAVLNTVGSAVKKTGGFFQSLIHKLKNTASQAGKSSGAFKGLHGSSNSLSGGIFKLGNMFKMLLIRMALRSVINGAKEGFQNLAQYSGETNQSLSMLMSSLTQLKNSFAAAFAPILNVVAPILSKLINMLSQAATYVGMFFAALTGKSTFTKAKAVQQDYAASLNNAASSASNAADAAKEYQNQVMGFDELNKMSDQSSGSSSGAGNTGASGVNVGDMFEEVAINSKLSDLAEKVKSIFSQIFQPFKESWAAEGQNTIASIEYALSSVWGLIKSIGSSFLQVWTNGTGTKLLTTIHQILQNIFNIIGNIANAFREAWEKNEVGTRIVQALFNNLQVVVDTIKKITGATAEWAKTLNFTPLLESVCNYLEKWKPVLQIIGDTLTRIWTNVVLPFVGWLIESALPKVLDGLSGLFNFLSENEWIVEAITVAVVSFFTAFKAVKFVTSAVSAIASFCTPMNLIITVIVALIAGFVALYKNVEGFRNFVDSVVEIGKNLITGLFKGIASVVSDIASFMKAYVFDPIINAFKGLFGIHSPSTVFAGLGRFLIEGLINGIKELLSNITKLFADIWGGIKAIFSDVSSWFGEKFNGAYKAVTDAFSSIGSWFGDKYKAVTNVFSNIGSWFKDKFTNAFNGVKSAFSGVGSFFSGVWNGITNIFSNVSGWFRDKFSDAWTAVKNVFSAGGQIFDGIKDGILNGLKSIVNGIISGINRVISVPFNGLNSALRTIRNVSIMGLRPFGWLGSISVPYIPMLASGGVVGSGQLFVANEAGPELVGNFGGRTGVMNNNQIVESVSRGVYDAVMAAMMNSKGSGSQEAPILEFVFMVDSETFYKVVKTGEKKSERRYTVTTQLT